ncbi:MAG: hypothetical protein PHV62_02235 [Sulfuricurvum sp.]|nr:hypothetical protein [Sulfuricurvum sp.]
MELKDVILSTLAELDDIVMQATPGKPQETAVEVEETAVHKQEVPMPSFASVLTQEMPSVGSDDEVRMLEGIRERLLVLFEGFQSPNNVNIEAKVDLTLNFFEYLLATIDNRLDTIR